MNPYKENNNKEQRVFKTPLIVPISVIMVIVIHFGYQYLYFSGEDIDILTFLKKVSFEVFLLCELGIISLIIYNKVQLKKFLGEHPLISSRKSLEALMPIARTNMYSTLFTFVFLGLGALTAIMSIVNNGTAKGIFVAALSIATSKLIAWYSTTEEEVKQIECGDDSLDLELNKILDCWMNKLLPDF